MLKRLIGFFLIFVMASGLTYAADDASDVESATGSNLTNLCSVLSKATTGIMASKTYVDEKAARDLKKLELLNLWANILYKAQINKNVSIDAIDTKKLAALMADIDEAERKGKPEGEEESWSSFDYARMALSVASIADPTGVVGVAAAYTYPKCGTTEARTGVGGFCWKDSHTRGVGIIPKSCQSSRPDYDAGLCYKICQSGFKGVGPVCWTNTRVSEPRGVGVIPKACPSSHPDYDAGLCYKRCRSGYNGAGPVCWNKKSASYGRGVGTIPNWFSGNPCGWKENDAGLCYKRCNSGYKGVGPVCWLKQAMSHVRGVGIIPKSCQSSHPDYDAGLCYKNCKRGYNGVGPVCWTTKRISHTRGVGVIPTGCSSSHPNYDAGLCYKGCRSGFSGVGPVCWSGCNDGKLNVACAAGCASSSAECGLATADMVASPFEMVGSIATLGSWAAANSAKKGAVLAAKQGTKAVVKEATKKAVKKAVKSSANALGDLMVQAARSQGGEVAESVVKQMVKQMTKSSKVALKRTSRAVGYIKKNSAKITKQVEDKVFQPVADTIKALKNQKQVAKLRSIPKKLRSKSQVLDLMMKAREKVAKNSVVRAERLARNCTKAGFTIQKAALK